MVPDNTREGSHASIAPIGFALTAYTIGVERGFITRVEAIRRTLTTLRFFRDSEQSEQAVKRRNRYAGRGGFFVRVSGAK